MDSIKDVYRKGKTSSLISTILLRVKKVSGAGNEQSKLKEKKEKKRKKKNSSLFEVELQKWTQIDSTVQLILMEKN